MIHVIELENVALQVGRRGGRCKYALRRQCPHGACITGTLNNARVLGQSAKSQSLAGVGNGSQSKAVPAFRWSWTGDGPYWRWPWAGRFALALDHLRPADRSLKSIDRLDHCREALRLRLAQIV